MNLGDLKYVSLTSNHLPPNMTNEQWQKYFSIMKAMISQRRERRMKSRFAEPRVNGVVEKSEHHGDTSYMMYCRFINGILQTIRGTANEMPQHDYCFYPYHIADLLRYEHDRLRTIWLEDEQCFEVWLDG